MNDRELLELAAKAVGIEHPGGEHCLNGPALWDCKSLKWWRPLTDDGDALRLAVKLGMDIFCSKNESLTMIGGTDINCHELDYSDDHGKATRRAIVRAAAEIGATQPSKDGGGHGQD